MKYYFIIYRNILFGKHRENPKLSSATDLLTALDVCLFSRSELTSYIWRVVCLQTASRYPSTTGGKGQSVRRLYGG
jgi:hypothetical protein